MDNPVFVHDEDIPLIDDEDKIIKMTHDMIPLTQAGLKRRCLLNQPAVRLKPAEAETAAYLI